MRRFVGLLFVLFFVLPLGVSLAGCGHSSSVEYCNGSGYGPATGQVKTIILASNLTVTGESLNYGQIGSALTASAYDCHNTAVTVSKYTYATTDMSVADVNPNTGSVCGGSWNRNTGGGIADYTVCTAPPATNTKHNAIITATAQGAVSNAIAVYVHAPVTAIVLANQATTDCSVDPGTDCCPVNTIGTTASAPVYSPLSCISQNDSRSLVAKAYANGRVDAADNITCQVGHLVYSLVGSSTAIASIDANGVITASQPGSALVTATVSNASSAVNAGFFSTCPPASITLSAVNQPAGSSEIAVRVNNPQAFNATVFDTNTTDYPPSGKIITGIPLVFNSTLPVNFPVSSGTVTPAYPGTATITAVCQPPTCNNAPFSQLGYLGNGKAVTSNGIQVTAPGTASDVVYMGSLQSQYLAAKDFTTGQLSAPIKLPYTPNSMVISQDGSAIYMGSAGGLMIVNTSSGSVSGTYQAIQGTVLAVAPNNTYVIVTDPTRDTVSLVTPTGTVSSSVAGVGTRAQWTPDSTLAYVAANGNQLLTYSTYIGWETTTTDGPYTDVAVTVPSYGAFFAKGASVNVTEGRSYCPITTADSTTTPPTTSNIFSPLANQTAVANDRLTATTDGAHILGVRAPVNGAPATVSDLTVNFPSAGVVPNPLVCTTASSPVTFNTAFTTHPISGITASSITGVVASGNSAVAAVTYTGSGSALPLYAPSTGAITNVPLSGAAIEPLAGVFSTDDTTFYVGTSGDNVVHVISITGTTGTDTGTIAPALPAADGTAAAPNLIVRRTRRTNT